MHQENHNYAYSCLALFLPSLLSSTLSTECLNMLGLSTQLQAAFFTFQLSVKGYSCSQSILFRWEKAKTESSDHRSRERIVFTDLKQDKIWECDCSDKTLRTSLG